MKMKKIGEITVALCYLLFAAEIAEAASCTLVSTVYKCPTGGMEELVEVLHKGLMIAFDCRIVSG